MTETIHPLALNTQVEANRPQCPCKGASYIRVTGKVKKVIKNQAGYWYYLDTGATVSAAAIVRVID